MTTPTLVCCSHGTASLPGRAVISGIARRAAEILDVPHAETYVDVQHPRVDEVVAALPGPSIVVPLLLSPGFHTQVDIGRAVAEGTDAVAAQTLGPHPALAAILAERVRALGPADAVVLAAAGSSRPESAACVREMRDALAELVDLPVSVGFAYGATPRAADAVSAARAAGARQVVVASYVLAPGHFADLVAAAGADAVTAPVGTDPRVAEIVAERYRAALA
ncbi:MAG: sirohydrochlorin chelatase [Microbacterium gubbeenense]|uniref:sirohydrochlorin chelatase n=1 Tax=Microbacterium gubbeenense TaxID=159896 RepID=UPI003F9CB776